VRVTEHLARGHSAFDTSQCHLLVDNKRFSAFANDESQSLDMKIRKTYQNIRATEAKSWRAAPTCRSSGK
jgi:hypothetical protein